MKTIIFVVSHGIETKLSTPNYCPDFIEGIEKELGPDVRFIPHLFNWDVLVRDREDKTYEMVKHLGHGLLRKLICSLGCDILWYSASQQIVSFGSVFADIHQKLKGEIRDIVMLYPDAKIVLCGHSWGSQIVLDFCFMAEPEIRQRIVGLVTMGSPILYKSGQYDDWGHPPTGLKFWLNFFNPLDPVSTEISKNENFKSAVEDVEVKSWNPLVWLRVPFIFSIVTAHTYYWKAGVVRKRIAAALVGL